MYAEPLHENLVDELTRLVGRPMPVVREALARLLTVVEQKGESEVFRSLAPLPLTAWQVLAPDLADARDLWTAVMSAGLTTEEVFTTLAVVDDHVRRRFGSDAWNAPSEWARRLIRQYRFEPSQGRRSDAPRGETGFGVTAGA